MSRPGHVIAAEWDARNEAERRGDWDHLLDGRDEPPPEPPPSVPEEFRQHCQQIEAAMVAQQRRRLP